MQTSNAAVQAPQPGRRDAVEQIADLLGGAPEKESENELENTTLGADDTAVTHVDDSPETGEETEGGEGQEASQGEIHDLAALAQAIGVEEQWIYELEVPMPDGREPLKLGEFKDRLTQLDRDRQTIERQRAQIAETERRIEQALAMATQVPQVVQDAFADVKAIESQYNRIDWDQFEKKSPGQAALTRQKLNDAYSAAQQRLAMAQQQTAQVMGQLTEQKRIEETQRLLEQVPEWRNRDTAVRERDLIVNTFASRYGVDPRELLALNDHRYVRAMRDLALLLQEKGSADAAMKKVRSAPRTLRPIGNAANRQKAGARKQAALTQRARELGTSEAKQAAIANLLSLKGIA